MTRKLSLVILICLTFTASAFAAGYENAYLGVRASAMAGAFTGLADDASAVHYNPAGLTQTKEGEVNYEATLMVHNLTLSDKTVAGESTSSTWSATPQAFISKSFGNWAAGFGIYPAGGAGGMNYKDLSKDPNFSSYQNVKYGAGFYSIALSLAAKVTPNLSVGLTEEIFYSLLSAEFMNGNIKIDDSGMAGSRTDIGLLYTVTPDLKVGCDIKAPATMTFSGTKETFGAKTDHQTIIEIPWYFNFGLSYKGIPDLTLLLQWEYKLWGDTQTHESISPYIPANETKPFINNNRWAIGAEYKVSPQLALRLGLDYFQHTLKEQYLDIMNPTNLDSITSAIGLGYSITPNLSIDFALNWTHAFENKSTNTVALGGVQETISGEAYFGFIGVRGKL